MTIVLPEPHINQNKILDDTNRFKVVMCGRRFGKSELSQIEIITRALQGQQVAYITPTYKLAKHFFEKLTQAVPFKNNKSDLIITFPNGGTVEFFTGERLDNLRGRKFHYAVIDEASFIPDLENGWLNSMRPTLTDYQGGALFLSTPKGKNYFYKLWTKGQMGDEGWASYKFTTYDNPYILQSEIEEAKAMLPQGVFNQEYMASPLDNAANPFGIAYINQCVYPLSTFPAVCYAVDLAKSYDYTVIIGLDKLGGVCHFQRFQMDWAGTTREVLNLPKGIPIIIDSTGVGDPIGEDIARHRNNVELFKFTANTKQQIMEGLAAAIQQRRITFPEGIIVQELSNFEYQYTNRGVKYSAPSGLHDDAVCALAMAVNKFGNYKSMGNYSMGFA